ncbi:hypothetical protein GXW78_18975 [Roseomonas terrae]|uniref:Lipoprotein SmpA/OmlA domain-containing protein n=1 Tax=Neoroseomonas terrae TaxID=424799 RepID=A0ABS5EL64_9PROT|nr:hypothetical protein [Neoroseomonas terrae]MBR0651760.1 hypothetical protein [Neoroseomonas terrae]
MLVLAGCATEAGFDARLQPLVGRSVDELVQTVGVPNSDFTTPEGRRFLQYDQLGSQGPSVAPGIGIGIGGFGWGGGGAGLGLGLGTGYPAYPSPCRTTFEVRADRVVAFSRSGAGCVA